MVHVLWGCACCVHNTMQKWWAFRWKFIRCHPWPELLSNYKVWKLHNMWLSRGRGSKVRQVGAWEGFALPGKCDWLGLTDFNISPQNDFGKSPGVLRKISVRNPDRGIGISLFYPSFFPMQLIADWVILSWDIKSWARISRNAKKREVVS